MAHRASHHHLKDFIFWTLGSFLKSLPLFFRSSTEGQLVLSRYREALGALALEVLSQLQFRRHQSRLEELDDELLDDNVSLTSQKILLSVSLKSLHTYPSQLIIR